MVIGTGVARMNGSFYQYHGVTEYPPGVAVRDDSSLPLKRQADQQKNGQDGASEAVQLRAVYRKIVL